MTTDPNDAAGRIAAFLDGAMIVVTASDGAEHGGCLVGFHTQASIEPWRHLVAVSVANHTFRVASRADHLAVHLLGAGDAALAERFGGVSEDDVADKFAGLRWHPSENGAPILDDCSGGWFVGRIVERVPLGDHHGMALEPVTVGAIPDADRRPLRFGAVRRIEPGHPA